MHPMRGYGLILFCASAFAAPLPASASDQGEQIDYETARDERRLIIVRAAGTVALDGVLAEPAWAPAPVARNFIQNAPNEGRPYHDTGSGRLRRRAIYSGSWRTTSQPPDDRDSQKDFNTAPATAVVLDICGSSNGYQFATNPAGAKWDAQMANEGRENNSNWDGIWEVRTRITEVGWTAEIRIPFKTLKFDRADPQTWGVNFERKIRRLNEDSYWSPLPRIYNIERVSLAGSIEGMRGVRPGRNLRVKPYALGSTNSITGFDTIRDGVAGFDVKYGLTTGTTWDFTVNTDFSQVEADEQQVNLSRFSLFFPEKRDFFLENSGIYQFGGGGGGGGGGAGGGRQNASQDMRLFFSRRIGLSDSGEAIPILAGTRLTGRMGSYTMGALNLQQRDEGRVPSIYGAQDAPGHPNELRYRNAAEQG
jgi:hypothetical protein